jgi:4-diphosphocytidyl-2C-methyl-D-erythritol kinase
MISNNQGKKLQKLTPTFKTKALTVPGIHHQQSTKEIFKTLQENKSNQNFTGNTYHENNNHPEGCGSKIG